MAKKQQRPAAARKQDNMSKSSPRAMQMDTQATKAPSKKQK